MCVVVPSLSNTLEALAAIGIGPFKVWRFQPPRLFDGRLRGEPATWSVDLALAWCGPVQFEVVAPSDYSGLAGEFLERCGPALQHVMVETNRGYSAALKAFAARGMPVGQSAAVISPVRLGQVVLPAPPRALRRPAATRFAYLDSREALGTTVELSKFPLGLSFERGTAIGEPDRWLPAAGKERGGGRPVFGVAGPITGVGIPVSSVSAAAEQWSGLLREPMERREDRAAAVVRGVRLELFEGSEGDGYVSARATSSDRAACLQALADLQLPATERADGVFEVNARERAGLRLMLEF